MNMDGAEKKYIPEGYLLLAPLYSRETFLVDGAGEVVHSWKGKYSPSNATYLLENGNLLRTSSPRISANKKIQSTAAGWYVQEIALDGKIIWEFELSNDKFRLHHDIRPLPNGNILMLAYERKTAKEALALGRNPKLMDKGFLLSECVIEVQLKGAKGGEIVWSWHLWDHLVQDYDLTRQNFGNVSGHPELLDINFVPYDKPDWVHLNSVDYNEETDQIMLSSRMLSEIWVIDHSTTKKEASSHAGGKSGKGGDILYRWGNPQVYGRGNQKDRQLFGQHDAQWIGKGLPGEGNILIYNNGDGRPKKEYSSIEEIVPPIKKSAYLIGDSKAYGPKKPKWSFSGEKKRPEFFSRHISGVQRLSNGNTVVCVGAEGYFFEVTPAGKQVWSYQNSFFQPDIFKKRIEEVKKFAACKPEKLNRKQEAVFKFRRYFSEAQALIKAKNKCN